MARRVVQRGADDLDRISQLPVEILDHIMGLLPIQQAARTAVLSKVWRDLWSSLSHLCFDHLFFSHFNKKYRRASKYIKTSSCFYVITKVLLEHKGSIRKFVCLHSNVGTLTVRSRSFDIDQWLLLVTRRGVEEIYLHFGYNEYKLPDCIFSCSTLRTLCLQGFSIEPQCSPCTLPNVTSLRFVRVGFGSRDISNYAVHVPRLENLSFIRCKDMFHFNITPRNLSSLTTKGCYNSESDKFLPVNLDLKSICTLDMKNCSDLRYFLGQYTTKGLSLQPPALNVELLKLSNFWSGDDDEISAFVCLLSNCPKLCNLELLLTGDLKMCIDATSGHLEKFRRVLRTQKLLSFLKLNVFEELEPHMHFIQEMLACLPALEKVVIIRPSYMSGLNEEHETMEEILHFPRASAKAKIVYQLMEDPPI
ncbi:unnamed protein product [Cuscuta campestris]|uniref:F-box domain-containing protein n=1 Tax=Cuscuta campestris TaxID=132261 RepID=A0A484N2L6_9ASTE|nr:unnamed protein product [Cuscuta campestris]